MTDHHVVAYRTHTPKRVATTITREITTHWWVACEAGCGRSICQGKVTWEPADPEDRLSLESIEITHTAPTAMRCAFCGPFPRE